MWKFLCRKVKMKLVFRKNPLDCRKAFTLIEVSIALVVLGMIAASVLVIVNRAIETVVLWQTKMQAFDIARENMEKILSQSSVSDMVEYGASETNPDITWETTIESFYEPVTNNLWVRAVCDAKFVDSEGGEQKIELTHWLTSLSKDQVKEVLEQKQREDSYQASASENPQDTGQNQDAGQNQDPSAAWKEMGKLAGPPPQGYENWGQVPQEQFWDAVKKTLQRTNETRQ